MINYTASQLTTDGEPLRRHLLTNWMSRDLMQASIDFCRNIGLTPLYAETSKERLTRYLFCRLPAGAGIEIRSGRPKEKFEELDRANRERRLKLLTLHIGEDGIYSAVWITADHFDPATQLLRAFGISPAEAREEAA